MLISESEKNRIINMYSPSKGRINEATATELQQLLNDTFKAGLTVDGKIGPRTISAIESALGGKTGSTEKSTTTTTTTGGGATGGTGATEPAAGTGEGGSF
jgi:hypothetical protein